MAILDAYEATSFVHVKCHLQSSPSTSPQFVPLDGGNGRLSAAALFSSPRRRLQHLVADPILLGRSENSGVLEPGTRAGARNDTVVLVGKLS